MIQEISILIPTYNDICVELVASLSLQAETCAVTEGLKYEILVADDGSIDADVKLRNGIINSYKHCRMILREKNTGRAAVRNFLAKEAKYDSLLFIDSDMTVVREDFLQRYLNSSVDGIVYGGYEVGKGDATNLRYRYERSCADSHTALRRQQHPYRDFHTSNFMIPRKTMLTNLLDERFRHYGYEDVLYGKSLKKKGVTIHHIDNPVGFCTFEDNLSYVSKTEEGLRTLYQFQKDLKGYSSLLDMAHWLQQLHLSWIPRCLFAVAGNRMRQRLCQPSPSLILFGLYRLAYFLNLKE